MKNKSKKEIESKTNNSTEKNTNRNKKTEEEVVEPVSKFLKDEKINILNSLNCTNEKYFVIHIFKNFDINHLVFSIPKFEEFNYTKIEDWVSSGVEFSIQKLNINSIKKMFNTEKPALLYIDQSFNRKKTYLTNEIEDDYDYPENNIFKILQNKSYSEKKNFMFLSAQDNDISTKLIMDLFNINNINYPFILGLRYNKDHKNFIKSVLSKDNLNETNVLIDQFIKGHKRNIFNEEDFDFDDNTFVNEKEIYNELVYKSKENDKTKYEIYMINNLNYKRIIKDRQEDLIYILLTYRKRLETEVINLGFVLLFFHFSFF